MSSASSGVELLLPPRHRPETCPHCLNLTTGPGLCRACGENEQHLAGVLPISYSVGGEWLHQLVASYKRDADPSVTDAVATLARLCTAFVGRHERCLAAEAAVGCFDIVTTVPSADPLRDLHHPLRRIVGELVEPTRDRYERLLMRSDSVVIPRVFDPARYRATRRLRGECVLLIDDMWTSGASAESAAAALGDAGAGTVAAVVIARHVNRSGGDNDLHLRRLAADSSDLNCCALCARGTA
jgi:predicted amidophosphoribosyltransferase